MMGMPRLSSREQRTVAVGGAIIAVTLLTTRVFPAWTVWVRDERAVAASLTQDLSAARMALDSLPGVLDTLLSRNERYVGLAPLLVAGETPSSAGIALMSLVSGTAASAGLKPGVLQLRVDTARKSVFSRVSIRGNAEGDVRGISRFLSTIEGGPMVLAVRHLTISQPDPGAGADRPEAIRIEFTIEGLALDSSAVRAQTTISSRSGQRQKAP